VLLAPPRRDNGGSADDDGCATEAKYFRQISIALATILGVALLAACTLPLMRKCSSSLFLGFRRTAKEHVSGFGSEADILVETSLPPRLRGCPTCWDTSAIAVTSPTIRQPYQKPMAPSSIMVDE
jgi:hypothetical protein